MDKKETTAIVKICLMSAFADNSKSDVERKQIKEIFENYEIENVTEIYNNVLLKKVTLDDTVMDLSSPETKLLAYEMAVSVCDSDDVINDKEKMFLENLKIKLGIDNSKAETINTETDSLVTQPLQSSVPEKINLAPEVDQMILKYSILNGALELLPQNLATLAIIPLQTKLVYDIGKKYNYNLDAGHIKEFIGTVGIGLTSQYIEGFARKFIGGFAKKAGGGLLGGIAKTATGAAMTFATTYALGKVANLYYSGGRTLSMDKLKSMFSSFTTDAKGLYGKYEGEIRSKASNLNVTQLLPMIQGKSPIL